MHRQHIYLVVFTDTPSKIRVAERLGEHERFSQGQRLGERRFKNGGNTLRVYLIGWKNTDLSGQLLDPVDCRSRGGKVEGTVANAGRQFRSTNRITEHKTNI